jgi:DNA-binding SARP family transcriptional activator
MLTLQANRVTSVDQLADAVWGPAAPPTARAQIQTCVSSLRRLFAEAGHPEAIETRAPGYLLHLSQHQLDLTRFERHLAQASSCTREGRPEEGLATLALALDLWRGEPLADLDSEVIRRHAVTLAERHREARLERARLEIEVGSHLEAVARLHHLIAADPYSEEPHRLLMLALHRSGRQAEALDVYRRARALFVDQLGIEPSQRLIDLEHMILNDEGRPAFAPDSPNRRESREPGEVPHFLPADVGDFVDRGDELRTIVQHFDMGAANALALPVLSISGPPGIGKSALAIHAAHACASLFVDGQLYASLQDSEPDEVRIRLLCSMGVDRSSIPDDPQLCAGLFRSRLAGKHVLLILDGASDEEQVASLLPGSSTCAVIVTSRRRLAGLAGACRIDLTPFSDSQALEFLRRVVGAGRVDAELGAAEDIVASCDRLPLALRIAAARLVSRPQWPLARLAERLGADGDPFQELSHGVLDLSAAIGYGQRDLPPRSAALLRLLALVEPATWTAWTAWTAAALLDACVDETQELLEGLADARLLLPVGAGQFQLPTLVRLRARQLLLAEVPPAVRQAALSRLHGAWLALAERAHREVYGGDHVVARGPAPRWIAAGPWPAAVVSDPLGWLRAESAALLGSLQSAYSHGDDELCWNLAVVLASLFTCNRQFKHARTAVTTGRRAAERAASPLGVAAVEYACGVLELTQGEFGAAETALSAAAAGFTACGDQHGYAMALMELASLDCVRSNGAAALVKCEASATALERGMDMAAEVRLLWVTANGLAQLGRTTSALGRLDWALALSRGVGYRRSEACLLYQKGLICIAAGEPEQAAGLLGRALDLAVECGDQLVEAIIRAALGRQACAAKAWHVAAAQLAAATALFDDLDCGRRAAEFEPALMTALTEASAELVPL